MSLLAGGSVLLTLILHSVPAQAAQALPPGEKPGHYVRWFYPAQLPYGPIENGNGSGDTAAPGAFLTLPFMGPHYVTSIFDHCGPNYGTHGSVCRYDGVVASAAVGGPDPNFKSGFAQTPGGTDYLYYEGHDGYDYGLYYEPVAAAAPGTVIYADWYVPSCHSCLSGMTIEIAHGNGLLSYYGHLSEIDVVKGQKVLRGQVIAISGMTGTATGPHLHFGVYYTNGSGPVDPYGWTGSAPDPYPLDRGDLWLTGTPRYADIPMPHVSVSATLDPGDPAAIDVSWSSPGAGDVFQVQVVAQDGSERSWIGSTGPGSAIYHGRPDQPYWFWVSVTTDLGWTDANSSPVIMLARPKAQLTA